MIQDQMEKLAKEKRMNVKDFPRMRGVRSVTITQNLVLKKMRAISAKLQ